MKTIRHYKSARDKVLHIETEGAVVNIRVGLTDAEGRSVTSVEIVPDEPDADGHHWDLVPGYNNRLIRREKKD